MEFQPLTLLAGPNSSGKSSVMQPLLLLKQTPEASYDPGAMLLHRPNARFSDALEDCVAWEDYVQSREGPQREADGGNSGSLTGNEG